MQINCQPRWQPAARQLEVNIGLRASVTEDSNVPRLLLLGSELLRNIVTNIEAKQNPRNLFSVSRELRAGVATKFQIQKVNKVQKPAFSSRGLTAKTGSQLQ
ncbi:hypothetical protein MDA_GLEAN10014249 [Myotis davidii]|uniref:Uncharacterized protein n=1 Tax=Myotis davidii TaxID=225400 RepID=L5M674_MYODS|nr:hypothetical protein MDA_GLEAN10014249 [Myotis davidii]